MPSSEPMQTLHAHIRRLAKATPKRAALLRCDAHGNVTEMITYKALASRIEIATSYLQSLSLKPGDRVGLSFRNSPELVVLSWAAWSAGIVTVPLDTKRDTGEHYRYKLRLAQARVLLAEPGTLDHIRPSDIQGLRIVEFHGFPKNTSRARIGVHFEPSLAHQALILFTSGTTAHPKGAELSLENLIVNAEHIRTWLHITARDRFLVNLPLHHVNSTVFCLSALCAGASIVIPPSYSHSRFWSQLAKTHATVTSVVQSIIQDQLSRKKEYAAVKKSLRITRMQIGSAPVVAHTAQAFMRAFRVPLYQGYGQTETALRVTGIPMELPKKLYSSLVAENSIGVPLSWAEVRIVNEKGVSLGEGQEGEIAVKGKAVMRGYVGGEPAFQKGYFLTGDIGLYRNKEGRAFFYLKGRKKEIIIKGGINISPIAVENELKKISHDIEQVYVIGVPDERYGEDVAAVICWKEGVDAVRASLRLKFSLIAGTPYLSKYETPTSIAVISSSALPMTSTGKVQRTELKRILSPMQFEATHSLFKTSEYRFVILDAQSALLPVSHILHNRCWAPLVTDMIRYREEASKQFILAAIDVDDALQAQVSFVRTGLSSGDLLQASHNRLLSPAVSNTNGRSFVCLSICSATYRVQKIPFTVVKPAASVVKQYLRDGYDPVLRFHDRPKAGQTKGARVIDVIEKGRPGDKSSCEYAMLLAYPAPASAVRFTEGTTAATQLVEAVLLLARAVGVQKVYAYSRPGGLAAYLSTIHKK